MEIVINIPKKAKKIRSFFFSVPWSAIAPKMGASNATTSDAIEFDRAK